MDIERALRNMDSRSRDFVKDCIEAYRKTGDQRYANDAIKTLENFDDSSDVRDLIRVLKK